MRAWSQAALAVGSAAGIRAEDERELAERGHVIFAASAKIADPGGKIGHSDQIVPDPGIIHHQVPVHLTCLALDAGE